MLYAVGGKQRAGKSYFIVLTMGDYLIYCERPILTNLPLRPDFMCMKFARRKIPLAKKMMSRIRLFVNCYSDLENEERKLITKEEQCEQAFNEMAASGDKFIKTISTDLKNAIISRSLNPRAVKYLHSHSPTYVNDFSHNMIRFSEIRRFWAPDVKQENSVVFLDEAYEAFSCMYYREAESLQIRSELMSYVRQHGHTKDDLYLISHNVNDLDVFIRRGIMYYYEIRNSKYTNVFDAKWMRGLKYPIQFFIVNGYETGESEPSDSWHIMPDRSIFKCYDSFSKSNSLDVKESLKDQNSIDTKIDHFANIRNWLKQARKWGYLLVFVVVCYFVLNKALFGKLNSKPKKPEVSNVSEKVEVQDNTGDKKKPGKGISPDEKDKVKISVVSISSSTVRYSDGVVIHLGDDYKGAKIEKISKNNIDFSVDGKRYKGDPLSLRR